MRHLVLFQYTETVISQTKLLLAEMESAASSFASTKKSIFSKSTDEYVALNKNILAHSNQFHVVETCFSEFKKIVIDSCLQNSVDPTDLISAFDSLSVLSFHFLDKLLREVMHQSFRKKIEQIVEKLYAEMSIEGQFGRRKASRKIHPEIQNGPFMNDVPYSKLELFLNSNWEYASSHCFGSVSLLILDHLVRLTNYILTKYCKTMEKEWTEKQVIVDRCITTRNSVLPLKFLVSTLTETECVKFDPLLELLDKKIK